MNNTFFSRKQTILNLMFIYIYKILLLILQFIRDSVIRDSSFVPNWMCFCRMSVYVESSRMCHVESLIKTLFVLERAPFPASIYLIWEKLLFQKSDLSTYLENNWNILSYLRYVQDKFRFKHKKDNYIFSIESKFIVEILTSLRFKVQDSKVIAVKNILIC